MKTLAVIPARGGSKRVEGKNVREFAGRPMLSWPVQAALDCKLFDQVMVSTDDPGIATVARAAGAEVPFMRSPVTADDQAGLMDVLAEVVRAYQQDGTVVDAVCCILATAAFVTPARLQQGHDLFMSGAFDSVFPVVRFGSPVQRALRRDGSGLTAMLEPKYYDSRSQDLEPTYHDAGQFYWMSVDACLKRTPVFSGRAGSFVVEETEVHDIDTAIDWQLAEMKHRLMRQGSETD